MDRAVLRKHKYENLTMLLNTPQALALLRSKSPGQAGVPEKPAQTQTITQSVMNTASIVGNSATGTETTTTTVAQYEIARPELPKLCLSPRFPPDGAAFYEISPPNSSVSTSPVTNSNPDLKSNCMGPPPTQAPASIAALTHTSWAAETMWKAQQKPERSNGVSDAPSTRIITPDTNNGFSGITPRETNGSSRTHQPILNESSTLRTGLSTQPAPESSIDARSDWFPPAPPPPLQSASLPSGEAEISKPNTASSSAKQTSANVPPSPNSDTPNAALQTNRNVSSPEPTVAQSSNHTLSTESPSKRTVSQSTTANTVTRPIPLKSSPVTDGPADYQRHHSLPGTTTITTPILDGRSVVPWKPTSRDLIPPTDPDPNVRAAVAAALSQSVAYSDDSPQWVPPKHTNPTHNVLAPTSEYVGTVPPNAEYAYESDRIVSEVQTTPRHTATAVSRPTCLTTQTGSVDQHQVDRIRQPNRRFVSESSSSSRRESGRRNRTTSDMDALHLLAEMGHRGMGQQLLDGSRSSDVGGTNPHTVSPTEAEWWRAQQRSGLLPYGKCEFSFR
ncbi:unnamed protein product [Echinostoma caproni]|uniref:Uncharacterized protein n=1 Tax=Echinostoma caproni TaxID=27848 RepID=A0A3P8G2P2_9TREM|nr:unnamed protein product [Echinostoma caproni]